MASVVLIDFLFLSSFSLLDNDYKEWELYDITVLISDLFIHFKFKKTHNQDYESVRKRIDTMLRRL